MIKAIIFDDHKAVRESLQLLLQNNAEIKLSGSFANTYHWRNAILKYEPDVVVMDIDIPGENGIEVTKLIKAQFPHIQVLIQTVHDDYDRIFASLCAGASGYILKGNFFNSLADAIMDVANGGTSMSPSIAVKVLELFRVYTPGGQQITNDDYALTLKEKAVLTLMVEGKMYKEIADSLHIAFETARSHVKNIYKKLHVASKSEAVAKAIKEKLI